MSFQLSPELDRNKVFLNKKSHCRTRLDPYYYKPTFSDLRERLDKNPTFQTVGSLIKSWNRGDGPRDGFYTNDDSIGVYFLRVNNLKEHTIDISEVKYITRYVHENTLKRAQVTAGDLIFAISGTKDNLGTVSIIPENIFEANLNSALVRLELDWSIIDKKYFCYMFDLGITKIQINFIGKGAAQNNLNNDEISQIRIYLPSMSEQIRIVDYLDQANSKKKEKEAEAQKLLDSIDDYLLGELGIELPEQEENTIQSRMFTRRLSEGSGGRLDPFFSSLNKQDKLGNYPFYNLKELAQIRKGDPISSDNVIAGNIPVIAGGQTSPYNHNKANNEGNIITVSASGAYSGYVWYHEAPVFASDCTMISSNTETLSNKYLFEYLKSEQQDIYNLQQGSGQPHVYPSDLEKIKIPLPPLEKQTEIANHITAIRDQAKALQQQAKADLEQAKKEVEAMILGEDEKMA